MIAFALCAVFVIRYHIPYTNRNSACIFQRVIIVQDGGEFGQEVSGGGEYAWCGTGLNMQADRQRGSSHLSVSESLSARTLSEEVSSTFPIFLTAIAEGGP